MGQYYYGVILNSRRKNYTNKEKVKAWLSPYDYGNGAKLMEHSYIGNDYVSAFEALINKENGEYAGYPIIWAGDYADEEPNTFKKKKVNVNSLCDDANKVMVTQPKHYRYVINEDKNLFIDTDKIKKDEYGYMIHPLPLLCADGNQRGGGDYYGLNEDKVGIWAYDRLGVTNKRPHYKKIKVEFKEKY